MAEEIGAARGLDPEYGSLAKRVALDCLRRISFFNSRADPREGGGTRLSACPDWCYNPKSTKQMEIVGMVSECSVL